MQDSAKKADYGWSQITGIHYFFPDSFKAIKFHDGYLVIPCSIIKYSFHHIQGMFLEI